MAITVTLTHDNDALAALREAWETLGEQCPTQSIYMTWDWVTTWWKFYGQGAELWLLQARAEDGRLIGLAPLMLVVHRPASLLRWRQLQFIGASSPFDHLDFLIEPGAGPDVLPLFLERLRAEQDRWDVLLLSALPEYSPTLSLLRTYSIPWEAGEAECCPAIALPADWETYHSALSKRKRKNIRHTHNVLDGAFPGRWGWERVEDPAELEPTMSTMIRLHQAKWAALGKPGGFADATTVAFHQAISRRLLEQGRLWLYRLCIDGRVAAIEYAYAYRDRVYAFASGVDFSLADYSPGQVLMEVMIREAIRAGMRHYDFLRGDEAYKFFWEAQCCYDHCLCWYASPAAQQQRRLLALGRSVWHRGKHLLPSDLRRRLRRLGASSPATTGVAETE